jgi:hypothetical protein
MTGARRTARGTLARRLLPLQRADNWEVYDRAISDLVGFMFRKGKATCFAFGPTGSGETATSAPLGSPPATSAPTRILLRDCDQVRHTR